MMTSGMQDEDALGGPTAQPPGDGGLFRYLADAAATHADAVHYCFDDHRVTYSKSLDHVLRVAGALRARGVGPGDRVGLALVNGPAYVTLCYALWRIGAVGVGMNLLYSPDHLAHLAVDADLSLLCGVDLPDARQKLDQAAAAAGCDLILCAADGAEFGNGSSRPTGLAMLLAAEPVDRATPTPGADAVAMLQYTGGTTGRPKGAALSHGAMMSAAGSFLTSFPRLDRGCETLYAAAPMTHVSGLMAYVCVTTAMAGEILLVPRFDPVELADQLRAGRISFMGVIPTMLTALLRVEGLGDIPWRRLKYVMAGGGPTPAELIRRFHAVSGIWVQQSYGMTETCGVGVTMPVEAVSRNLDATGAPIPGVTVELRSIDDPSVSVGPNEPGEICVGRDCLMDGYWGVAGSDHLTRDGLMRTGDIGIFDPAGLLHVVDRLKDMVVCSGYNVYPRVIDEAVAQHPDVIEAIAVGVPDDYRGETILVAAVLRPGASLTLEALQWFLETRLSAIEMPKRLVLMDSLPKSENGKLSRLLVREKLEREDAVVPI